MAEYNIAEEVSGEVLEIETTDVMTGDRNRRRFLYYQLKMSIQLAKRIDIIVSFLMESGVRLILGDLKAALDRGASIRLLTGNYLGITQPSALYLIKKELGDQIDLRFYNHKERSFHPKAYIFHYENGSEIYIGSSNISRSALTSGIEWNYRFSSRKDKENFNLFYSTFIDLFEKHSIIIDDAELKRYSKSWHKPAVEKDLEKYDNLEDYPDAKVETLFQPRGAQIEALYALEDSRAEGAVKGLVQAATGIGKTYLAAFDSAKYERVLFVAHREEILKQAAISFRNVRNSDYSGFRLIRGHYEEKDLNAAYIGNARRYDLIYKHYMKYRSKRAFGFCCSRKHAEETAKEFCQRGIPSVAVYSNADGAFSEDRDIALERLKKGDIKVIFSIDMFNEGVDLPQVDMVLFLRPTESPVVFLQQLGRGLRKSKGKEYLNVLDFIGNYEKAGKIPQFLGGEMVCAKNGDKRTNEIEYPDDCIVDFDMRLIDLFREMEKKGLTIHELIRREYFRVKEMLGDRTPDRMELFNYMEDEIYQLCIQNVKENPFRRYLEYLHELQELSAEEELLYNGIGREFLNLLETTDMQKVYKMPVLDSFYNDGDIRMAVTEDEVLEAWKKFFSNGTNWKDLGENMTYEEYMKITDRQHLSKAKSMPIRYLKASGKGFFIDVPGYAIGIRRDLEAVIGSRVLQEQMKDIIEYRTMEYYRRRYRDSRWKEQ